VRELRHLAVGVEAVDAELEFSEDAAGGIGLAIVEARHYHLQKVGVCYVGVGSTGRVRRRQASGRGSFVGGRRYREETGSDRRASES
jgi:hypothetical protein